MKVSVKDEWRRYCNAWILFSRQKYPGVSEQSWKAWLDDERTGSLNGFLH